MFSQSKVVEQLLLEELKEELLKLMNQFQSSVLTKIKNQLLLELKCLRSNLMKDKLETTSDFFFEVLKRKMLSVDRLLRSQAGLLLIQNLKKKYTFSPKK